MPNFMRPDLHTISLPWEAKPIKDHQPWIKENTYLGTIRSNFLCLSQAHVRKVAPESRGTHNCRSTINFWTAGPGIGFRFFFNVVKFLHLAKTRKGRGGGGGCDFQKGSFGDKMAQSCHISWRKKKVEFTVFRPRVLACCQYIGV